MGCPHIYYIRALQLLARAIAYETDSKLAREFDEELSEERLKTYITAKKAELSEKDFAFPLPIRQQFLLLSCKIKADISKFWKTRRRK